MCGTPGGRSRPRSGQVSWVPSGKIKWYDADKGFGFIAQDGGGDDVHVRSSALPTGLATLKPGQKVEYGVADGRRGPQALQELRRGRYPDRALGGRIAAVLRAVANELDA